MQVVRRFVLQGQGLEQHGQIVGVTADDLQKAIRARHQGGIVDAMRIHLAKAKLTALGDKAPGVGQVVIPLALVPQPQALLRTIDHHRRLRQGFWTRIGGGQAEFFEIGDFVGLDCQLGAAAHEGEDLDPVIEQRPILMERELVELQVALQVEQQANEGLAEGAGPDDVHDAFGTHLVSSSRWRVPCFHLLIEAILRQRGIPGKLKSHRP